MSGRQESGQGGVLITADIDPAAVDELIANDPYQIAGLVRYERLGFNRGRCAPGL